MLDVWYVLDVLMAIGLELVFNCMRRREEGARDPDGPVTRCYLEANTPFFVTAGVTILFLHNWFLLPAEGGDSLQGNHQAWIIWAAVDVLVPVVLGVTGCRLWQEGSRASS